MLRPGETCERAQHFPTRAALSRSKDRSTAIILVASGIIASDMRSPAKLSVCRCVRPPHRGAHLQEFLTGLAESRCDRCETNEHRCIGKSVTVAVGCAMAPLSLCDSAAACARAGFGRASARLAGPATRQPRSSATRRCAGPATRPVARARMRRMAARAKNVLMVSAVRSLVVGCRLFAWLLSAFRL